MNNNTKNKFLIGIVALLILANITSIALFWIGKPNQQAARQKDTPTAFLITELNLDKKQQAQLDVLKGEHQQAAGPLREQLAMSKKSFFELLQQPALSDTQIIKAENTVTAITVKLDLLAFDHFKKIRKICTEVQKEKFDKIIFEVAQILGNPAGPHPPGNKPPPPYDADKNRPPLDEQDN